MDEKEFRKDVEKIISKNKEGKFYWQADSRWDIIVEIKEGSYKIKWQYHPFSDDPYGQIEEYPIDSLDEMEEWAAGYNWKFSKDW